MNTKREFWQRNVVAVVGMLVFSAGINLFIVPANLYNGGVLGISQVIRTVFSFGIRDNGYCGYY